MDSDNTIKRRDFLGTSSAAAIVGAASLNAATGELLAGNKGSRLECSHFEDLVGDAFQVGDKDVVLKLVDATAQPARDARPAECRQQPFSLVFTAPSGTEMDDAIHRLHHRNVGSFDVLVQQIELEAYPRVNTYEVVFA